MRMSGQFERVNEIVAEALELPPAAWDAFLASRCGEDGDARAAAERLLGVSDSLDGFLDMPESEIQPGDVLGGRFRVLAELGIGAAGTTYAAEDAQLGEVALKVPHPEIALERFAAEVRHARAVRHPNVCPVFDLFTFEHKGRQVTAATMRCLRGETLACRLARGAMTPAEALPIARGIAQGIDALHAEGIVHCDLKPENIMLTRGPDGATAPVIMDFGLACLPSAGCAEIAGSPDYMAPERFRSGPATAASDIYAFGMMLFEMIAGVRPFPPEDLLSSVVRRVTEDAPPLSHVIRATPRAYAEAVARTLSRDASRRPRSAGQVIAEIEQASAGAPRVAHGCAHGRFNRQAG